MKERALRLVLQLRSETGEKHGSVRRVTDQLDIGVESLRSWVHQYEIDHVERPGLTSDQADELSELRQEVEELRRVNAILESASAFLAGELDRPQT